MDLVGEFHKMEIDGKLSLVYRNILKPLPQIHSPNSSNEKIVDSYEYFPLFLCPNFRGQTELRLYHDKEGDSLSEVFCKYNTSPLFDDSNIGHHVLPLFWCNNKEDHSEEGCVVCSVQTIGADYYFCGECDERFHKECVESPLEISYPSHLKHSFQLYFSQFRSDHCICCGESATYLVYCCVLCDIYMHVYCAQVTIPFFIDQPKRHDHTLTLFPRQALLTCNICALVNEFYLTYICAVCDFVFHSDCLKIPQTIKISRHHHRISFKSSHPFQESSCGVCRRKVVSHYGAYSCHVCSGYAVHTRCALRRDIWDRIDLEGVPEEEEEDLEMFERIADGIILHFTHDHHLKLEISGVYDSDKACQACVLPIYDGNFYECVECDFILHETCANAPFLMFHPLHPHPLQHVVVPECHSVKCGVCTRLSNGFVYVCPKKGCEYQLDLRCALASEPFTYQGHQHPLFLALDPKEKPICNVCKSPGDHQKVLNCIECEFIICFECATLPYMARYKHDEHYLTFCRGDEASGSDWCELCEGKLAIGGEKGFYSCNVCCTTLHINCLLGIEPYLMRGQTMTFGEGNEAHIVHNNSSCRPICMHCHRRCPYPIYLAYDEGISCSYKCSLDHIKTRQKLLNFNLTL